MRNGSPTRHYLTAALLLLALAAGCAPSRSQYYGDLRATRLGAYRRWERQEQQELKRPRLEGRLSLEDAVRLSLQYSPLLQAAVEEREVARGRVVEAYSTALPSVDVTGGYTRLDQVTTVDLGVETYQVGDRDNYSYRVQVTQPIYKGGSTGIALRAARLYSYLSDEVVLGTAESVVFQVAGSYYDAVLAERMIEVQRAALEFARANLKDVESRRRHGAATEYEVLRARVDVANVEADLLEQVNRRDISRTALLRAIGASQRSDIELATDLTYRETAPDFMQSVRMAFQNRPDIYQAAMNVDLMQEALNEVYTHYLPSLEAYYWHLWARPDPHTSDVTWGRQWQAGLSLTWHLFDGLAREGRAIQQKALLRQAAVMLSNAEEQAIQEIRNAILELENADKIVRSQKLNVKQAERALELVQVGYKEGVNTQLQVLDARAALTRTQGLYQSALHRHVAARVDLQRSIGILVPRRETAGVPKQVGEPGYIEAFMGEAEGSVQPEGVETP